MTTSAPVTRAVPQSGSDGDVLLPGSAERIDVPDARVRCTENGNMSRWRTGSLHTASCFTFES